MNGKGTEIVCPCCKKMSLRPEDAKNIDTGDVSICTDCRAVSILGEDGKPRLLTYEDLDKMTARDRYELAKHLAVLDYVKSLN